MNPVTLAIVAAIAAKEASGATQPSLRLIDDSFGGLKMVFEQAYGNENALLNSIAALEAAPNDQARAKVEHINAAVNATQTDQNLDVIAVTDALLDLITAQPNGPQMLTQLQELYQLS